MENSKHGPFKVNDIILFKRTDETTQLAKIWFVRPDSIMIEWTDDDGTKFGKYVPNSFVIKHFPSENQTQEEPKLSAQETPSSSSSPKSFYFLVKLLLFLVLPILLVFIMSNVKLGNPHLVN